MDGLALTHLWLAYDRPVPSIRSCHRPLLAALALGLSVGLSGAGWGTVAYVAVPTGYALNLRWGPSTQFGVARRVAPGTALSLSGRQQGGWVQLVDGTWVAANLVRQGNSGPSVPLPSPPPGGSVVYVNPPQGYVLNGREGPGTGFPIVVRLLPGSQLQLSGQVSGNWAQTIDGIWVDRGHLQTNPVQTASYDPALADAQTRLKALNYLPANYAVTGIYDSATTEAVRSFQRVNGLTVDGIVGPITQQALVESTRFLSGQPRPNQPEPNQPEPNQPEPNQPEPNQPEPNQPPSSIAPPTAPQTRRVSTYGGQTVIFSGPGTEYAVVDYVDDGTTVAVTGRTSGEYTELADGGWILSFWLEPIE